MILASASKETLLVHIAVVLKMVCKYKLRFPSTKLCKGAHTKPDQKSGDDDDDNNDDDNDDDNVDDDDDNNDDEYLSEICPFIETA